MTIKKIKGLKIAKDLLEKFKFTSEGNSNFGSSAEDSHSLMGDTETSDIALTGQLTLEQRISSALFGAPQLTGNTGPDILTLNELKTNASQYEGFIIYLTEPSILAPFRDGQKFYFCENGEWHPSPFIVTDDDLDGDGIPDTEDPFTTETTNDGSGEVVSVVFNTTNLQNDTIFETDPQGDVMIQITPGQDNGNFELDDQGDVMPSAS